MREINCVIIDHARFTETKITYGENGKITKKEMQGVPHYLLDVANPKKRFSVAQYQKLALSAIKKIQNKNNKS